VVNHLRAKELAQQRIRGIRISGMRIMRERIRGK